jgi:hypothetical protein
MSVSSRRVDLGALCVLVATSACQGATPTPAPTTSVAPAGPLPPAEASAHPLAEYCGGATSQPCPKLRAAVASLRAQCPEAGSGPSAEPPFWTAPCGAYTVVQSDFGIVGYVQYFDGSGVVVGAIANVYEHGVVTRFGTVPACTQGAITSLCSAH